MYVVTVIFEIEREEVENFLARVQRQARDSLDNEPGCRRFDVSVSRKQRERILLYEIYDNADAFAEHLASPHFVAFDREVSPYTRSKHIESWSLT